MSTLLVLLILCICYHGSADDDQGASPFISDNFLQLPEGGRVLPTLASGTLGSGTIGAKVGSRVAINHGDQEVRLYDPQASITRNTPSALIAPGLQVLSMANLSDGGLAVGTGQRSVLLFSADRIVSGSSPHAALTVQAPLSSIVLLSDGGMAVATAKGIELFSKEAVEVGGRSHDTVATRPGARIKSLLVLTNGDLAVGMLGQDVLIFNKSAQETGSAHYVSIPGTSFTSGLLEYDSFLAVSGNAGVQFFEKKTWKFSSELVRGRGVSMMKELSGGRLALAMTDQTQGVLLFSKEQALHDGPHYGTLSSMFPIQGGSVAVSMNSVHGSGLAVSWSKGGVMIYNESVVRTGGLPYTVLIPQTEIDASLSFRYDNTCLAAGTKSNGVALFNTTGFKTISESFITLSLTGRASRQPGSMLALRNGMFAVGTTTAVELFDPSASGSAVAILDLTTDGWQNVQANALAELEGGELAVGAWSLKNPRPSSGSPDIGGVQVFDPSSLAPTAGVSRRPVKRLGPPWGVYSLLVLPNGGLAVGLNGGFTDNDGSWWGSVWLYNETAVSTRPSCRDVTKEYGVLCVGEWQVCSLSMLSNGGLAAGLKSSGVYLFDKSAVDTGRSLRPLDDQCHRRQKFATASKYGQLASHQDVKSLLPLHNGGLAVGGSNLSLYSTENLSESFTGVRHPYATLSPDRGTWIQSLIAMGEKNDTLIAAPEVFNARQCASGQFALPGDPDCKPCHQGWLSTAGDSVCMYPEFCGWMSLSIVATVVVVLLVLWAASYQEFWRRLGRCFDEPAPSDIMCADAGTGGDGGRGDEGAQGTNQAEMISSLVTEQDITCGAGPSAWIRHAVAHTAQGEGAQVTNQAEMSLPLVTEQDIGQDVSRLRRIWSSAKPKLWSLKFDFVAAAFCVMSFSCTNDSNQKAQALVVEVALVPPLRSAIGVGLANLLVSAVAALDPEKARAFCGFRIMGWMLVISVVVLEFVALSKGAARYDVTCQAVWTPLGVGCGEDWVSLALFTLAAFMGLVSIASQSRYTWRSYSERPNDSPGRVPCAGCIAKLPTRVSECVSYSVKALKGWAGMHFLAAANGGVAAVIFITQLAFDIHSEDPYRGLLVTCFLLATMCVGLGIFNMWCWRKPSYLWLADRHFRLTGVLKYALLVAKTCSLTMPHQEELTGFDCLWSCRVPSLCPPSCTQGNIRGICTLSEGTLHDGTVEISKCFCSGRWYSVATLLSSFCSSGLLAVFAFINVWKVWKSRYFHGMVKLHGGRGHPALVGYLLAAIAPQGMAMLNLIEVISDRKSCLDMGTVAMTLVVMLPMYMVSSDAKWQMASYYEFPTFGALYGENAGSGMRALKPLAICSCGVGVAFLAFMLKAAETKYCFMVHSMQLALVVGGLVGMCLFPGDFSPIEPAYELENRPAIYDPSNGLIIDVGPRRIN